MRILGLFMSVLLSVGCASESGKEGESASESALTSVTGVERRIQWDSFVYVKVGADVATVQKAISLQIKSAIGSLRSSEIALQKRDASSGLDPATWKTEALKVVDTDYPGRPQQPVLRVRYHYVDTAMVRATSTSTTFQLPLIFGDYLTRAGEILPRCSDYLKIDAYLLWFHFTPTLSTCQSTMSREASAVDFAAAALGHAPRQTSLLDVNRLYLTVRADLSPAGAAPTTYPEYHRLWGFGTDRTQLVIYALFGVNEMNYKVDDSSLVEYMRFLRTLRAAFPQYHVTLTRPHDNLLDFSLDGARVSATHEDTFDWVIDGKSFPAGVTDPARREKLKQQVLAHYAERWIYWDLPVTVARGAESRDVTVQVRAYWGNENGTIEYQNAAHARYAEGMLHGDVFVYQGHSHYGLGPLDPRSFSRASFPVDRYQTMLFNSCISFNHYDLGYLGIHPGGTRNLDVVVNGLSSYWHLLGQSSASYVLGLTDGKNRSWEEILSGMIVTPNPMERDPMRAVNGELDNEFNPNDGMIRLKVKSW
jgi:hypothetical protein